MNWAQFYNAWLCGGVQPEFAAQRADEWETERREVDHKHEAKLNAFLAAQADGEAP